MYNYRIIKIEDIEYALPDSMTWKMFDDVSLYKLSDSSCMFNSPYGTVHITSRSFEQMLSLLNVVVGEEDLEQLISILMQNGMKKESLPIFR